MKINAMKGKVSNYEYTVETYNEKRYDTESLKILKARNVGNEEELIFSLCEWIAKQGKEIR